MVSGQLIRKKEVFRKIENLAANYQLMGKYEFGCRLLKEAEKLLDTQTFFEIFLPSKTE